MNRKKWEQWFNRKEVSNSKRNWDGEPEEKQQRFLCPYQPESKFEFEKKNQRIVREFRKKSEERNLIKDKPWKTIEHLSEMWPLRRFPPRLGDELRLMIVETLPVSKIEIWQWKTIEKVEFDKPIFITKHFQPNCSSNRQQKNFESMELTIVEIWIWRLSFGWDRMFCFWKNVFRKKNIRLR